VVVNLKLVVANFHIQPMNCLVPLCVTKFTTCGLGYELWMNVVVVWLRMIIRLRASP
jgi:hypothetical protein